MRQWFFALLGIALIQTLYSREFSTHYKAFEETTTPWFTGPLLTPSGHVVPEGHQNYEPYVYWTQAKGNYDSHWRPHSATLFNNVLTQITMQLGVLPDTEFDMAPQFVYNETAGEHMWRYSDLPITLAFQILKNTPDTWYPAIKLRFAANIPLGKFDSLNPLKLGTDAGGVGSWLPNVGLVFSRLFHITGHQYLASRAFFSYAFSTPVGVRGLSVYGGTPTVAGVKGTRGTVHTGNVFLFLAGFEYSLTQNWVLAIDIQYQHNNKRRFSGYTPVGTAPISPSKELFAVAPAIEYNWNGNIGLIAGPWLTVSGRNTGQFISYVVALNVYH